MEKVLEYLRGLRSAKHMELLQLREAFQDCEIKNAPEYHLEMHRIEIRRASSAVRAYDICIEALESHSEPVEPVVG